MRKNKEKCIEYSPASDSKHSHGFKNVRWVENVSLGLRFVNYADKLAGLDHRGWYTHDDSDGYPDETLRGIVYRLPSRKGEAQFVYGYADPCNDDCARLSFDPVSDEREAARYADQLAERVAESERDYHRAYGAGQRYRDYADEIQDMRRKALAIGAELRAARKTGAQAPSICALARKKILSLYRQIQKARKERAELLENFGSCEGFAE